MFAGQNYPSFSPVLAAPDHIVPTGGGGSHAHPFSGSLSSATADVTIPAADVKYANVIVATKD